MPDTARTKTSLIALLGDNVIGSISEQDLRDVVESAFGGYGALSVSGGATAQASIGTTAVQLIPYTTASAGSQCTPSAANDEIVLDVGGVWVAFASTSFSGSGNSEFVVRHRCTGDGTVAAGGTSHRKIGSGGDVGSAASMSLITGCSAGDVIDVTVEADSAARTITVTEASLVVIRIA